MTRYLTTLAAAAFFLFFHYTCFAASRGPGDKEQICAVCNSKIEGPWVLADGKTYHPACFKDKIELRCAICAKPINGVYARDAQGVYHETCFKNTRLARCAICSGSIEGRHVVDVWGQAAHTKHQGKETLICDSCGRIISPASRNGFRYSDKRIICGICKASAVTKNATVKKIMNDVSDMLYAVGIGPVSPDIPVSLVDRDTLLKKSHGNDKENTRGFTRSLTRIAGGKTLSFHHRIFILDGLPQVEFKGVLAHEMIHVWLNENKVKMKDWETEGFCNLGIMIVNDGEEGSKFARFLQNQLEQDRDRVYGEGYRLMKNKLDALGWDQLIFWVLSHGRR